MDISIEYCMQWNYESRALSLRDELSDLFGINSELIESGGGVFEIKANHHLIFRKKQLRRFPEEKENLNLIKRKEKVTKKENQYSHGN